MPLLSEILAEFEHEIASKPRRYPIVRSGEREPIPSAVRLSVYLRDGQTCRECGTLCEPGDVELDHMLPWSAGGSDASDNLRVLCRSCNQRRSNWDDGAEGWNARPTTWWCWECWRHPDLDPEPSPDDFEWGIRVRGLRPVWRSGVNLAAVPYVRDVPIQAYCAWCRSYTWTDTAFVAGQQTQLARLVTPTAPEPDNATEEAHDA